MAEAKWRILMAASWERAERSVGLKCWLQSQRRAKLPWYMPAGRRWRETIWPRRESIQRYGRTWQPRRHRHGAAPAERHQACGHPPAKYKATMRYHLRG